MLFVYLKVKIITTESNVDNNSNNDNFLVLYYLINNEESVVIKHMLLALVGMFFITSHLNAIINPYEALRKRVMNFGEKLEKVENVPMVGKLTSLLPLAMLAAGLQKCPGQTMMLLAGFFAYVLAHNESVRALLTEYNIIGGGQTNNQTDETDIDDTLFVFDGEDQEDAQEENDTEDELLGEHLLNDEDEQTNNKQIVQKPAVKFL